MKKKNKKKKKSKGCYIPSAYTILLIIEILIFILTYIIPKGKYDTIEYNSGKFIRYIYNETKVPYEEELDGTQETLNKLEINIKIENFEKGYIKKPISIPGSYKHLNEENSNFFDLFTYPILGMLDSADISFFLMMIGGCMNILLEMNSLTSGIEALGRLTKGHEIILLIIIFFLISIGGSTYGLSEETLSFYPILMPIFLKSGLDGAISAAAIYFGSQIGVMFSTVNAFSVVIGSYSAGINFIDGIVFRVIGFILGDALTIGYFLFYHKRVKADPEKSAVYDIKDDILKEFLKEEKEKKDDIISDEEIKLKENNGSDNNDNKNNKKINEFTIIQKISLILFGCAFILMIVGVTVLDWWFEQMSAIFLILGIILIFLVRKGEVDGIKDFTKGAGDFASVILIIGLARGINITLDEGLISDTLLNSFSNLVKGLPKILFAIIMLIVFIILGFFIQSSSGLAVLSMPVFAPLADEVNCSRTLIVNAYMFGQSYIGLLTPTGLTLIILQLIGMKYTHWIKFIWLYMIILFVFLVILMIVDSIIE